MICNNLAWGPLGSVASLAKLPFSTARTARCPECNGLHDDDVYWQLPYNPDVLTFRTSAFIASAHANYSALLTCVQDLDVLCVS